MYLGQVDMEESLFQYSHSKYLPLTERNICVVEDGETTGGCLLTG